MQRSSENGFPQVTSVQNPPPAATPPRAPANFAPPVTHSCRSLTGPRIPRLYQICGSQQPGWSPSVYFQPSFPGRLSVTRRSAGHATSVGSCFSGGVVPWTLPDAASQPDVSAVPLLPLRARPACLFQFPGLSSTPETPRPATSRGHATPTAMRQPRAVCSCPWPTLGCILVTAWDVPVKARGSWEATTIQLQATSKQNAANECHFRRLVQRQPWLSSSAMRGCSQKCPSIPSYLLSTEHVGQRPAPGSPSLFWDLEKLRNSRLLSLWAWSAGLTSCTGTGSALFPGGSCTPTPRVPVTMTVPLWSLSSGSLFSTRMMV